VVEDNKRDSDSRIVNDKGNNAVEIIFSFTKALYAFGQPRDSVDSLFQVPVRYSRLPKSPVF